MILRVSSQRDGAGGWNRISGGLSLKIFEYKAKDQKKRVYMVSRKCPSLGKRKRFFFVYCVVFFLISRGYPNHNVKKCHEVSAWVLRKESTGIKREWDWEIVASKEKDRALDVETDTERTSVKERDRGRYRSKQRQIARDRESSLSSRNKWAIPERQRE